jgi:pimeloyl-ACP methyl ester carboxylesterase
MPDKQPVNDVVVLLPGILGSVLEQDGREVWAISKGAALRGLATLGRSVKSLTLENDDPTQLIPSDGVRATRLMPDVHLLPGFWKIDGYGEIKQKLFERFELADGLNWHDFPYDWRRDNRTAAMRLAEQAPAWLESYRTRPGHEDAKLVLIGHSMGGLVARHFLEVLGGWKDTRALITFGTPYRGSVNALDFIVHGFKKGFGPFKTDLSDMLRSFTSVYQLLPTFACVDDGSGTYTKIVDTAGLPVDKVDPVKVAAAAAFHDEIASSVDANGGYGRYQIVPVVGIFQPTRQSAVLRDGEVVIEYQHGGVDRGGDGTVPRVSATPVEMSDERREVYATESHGSLQNFDSIIVQVAGVLSFEDLDGFKATPSDGFQLDVEDLIAPGEELVVTLTTLGPALHAKVTVENVDTGDVVEVQGELSNGVATLTVGGLPAGVYRLTGTDADGVGLRPVHDLVVVADDTSMERELDVADRDGEPAGFR